MKTTNQVLAETGLTYPMLNRLKDLGIVPKPRLKGMGRRKGVIGVFEDEVIDLINQVKLEKRQGLSLSQIAEQRRKELAGIRALEPSEEYLMPIRSDALQSYLGAYAGFHNWLQEQIGQQMPGYEFHSVEMEIVSRRGGEFLRPKEIKVRPKGGSRS